MATGNPFDLLGADDNDDPSQLIAAAEKLKLESAKKAAAQTPPAAKFPTKPPPPAQAVREARGGGVPSRGGGRFGERGRGRGTGPRPNREFGNGYVDGFSGGYGGPPVAGGEEGEAGRPADRERGSYGGYRPPYRGGGRRGGYDNGEAGDDSARPRRMFDRHSGTGRGNGFKREGAGRGNWGTPNDDIIAQDSEELVANPEEKAPETEKPSESENAPAEVNEENKEVANKEAEEKEEEDKEMTLEEYEKLLEEKRKALAGMKTAERKVAVDKELQSMQPLATKRGTDEIFIKLGSEKDNRKLKESTERDEKAKKSVTIQEFLKPAEGERRFSPRGRGRGRGGRGRGEGGGRGGRSYDYDGNGGPAPTTYKTDVEIKYQDHAEFPTLGGK